MAKWVEVSPVAVKPSKLIEGHYLVKNMRTIKIPPRSDEILYCGYAVKYDSQSEKVDIRDIIAEPSDSLMKYEYPELVRSEEVIKIYVHNGSNESRVILRGQSIAYMHVTKKTDEGSWIDLEVEE